MKQLIAAFLAILSLMPLLAYRDLETGAFLTRDPAGFIDGPNMYTYVLDDPWTHFDPEGLNTDADQAQIDRNVANDPTVGADIEAAMGAQRKTVNSGVQVAKAVQAAAELTPMQNVATAITGTDAIGNKVSGPQQAMAVVGTVLPAASELKVAEAVAKDANKLEQAANDVDKATSAGAKLGGDAKDAREATGATGTAATPPAKPSSPREGTYQFPDQTAPNQEPYVGQSGNIPNRLADHVASGRLSPGTETTKEVLGGQTAREVAEHNQIQEITGGVPARQSDAVANKRDPIGPNRQHLLQQQNQTQNGSGS